MADTSNLKFTKTHEWARAEGGTVAVGISDYAVEQLGDIVFVELPAVGKKVTAGGSFGVIESVKAAVELYAPVTGEVVETNQPVATDFQAISEDPFGRGWMIKIKAGNLAELNALMSAADYKAYCQSEGAKH
ncbi:MAG: glycine cleavage system protein GcvH [Phycisphaerae bacterium]